MLENVQIETIAAIAKEAGDAIMEIYNRDFSIQYKDDASPLTEADLKSNDIITSKLRALDATFGDIPILSEEGKEIPYEERKAWEYFWLIDPIDGTKEFIKKNGEFTVNIALIHKDIPVLGVVYAPALHEMYYAKEGEGAFKVTIDENSITEDGRLHFANAVKLPLCRNEHPETRLTIVASKSHLTPETKAFIDQMTSHIEHPTFLSKGSSLKLVMVASGEADIYPRLAPTMEWDTAAADAIVRQSGKMTRQYTPAYDATQPETMHPLVYNKESLLNPWFVVQ